MTYAAIGDLIEIAIQIENICQALYENMEKKFAHTPEIVSHRHRYALEEAGHARWLQSLRDKSTAEQLERKANAIFCCMPKKRLTLPALKPTSVSIIWKMHIKSPMNLKTPKPIACSNF
jgi:hypothetical protein